MYIVCKTNAYRSTGQEFESTYRPTVLQNWEVPKLNSHKPQKRIGKSRLITNDQGHLLPGLKKSQPWGTYIGTWRLPKKIDRKTANQLSGLDKIQSSRKKYLKERKAKEIIQSSINQPDKDTNKENIDDNNRKPIPYIPGDLTEDRYRLLSHNDLAKDRFSTKAKEKCSGFPITRDDFSKLPKEEKDLTKEVDEFYNLHKEMVNAGPPIEKPTEVRKERLLSPILNAINNFHLAKKLHKENLEHNPLPDTVPHAMYQKMQMEQPDQEPGLALEDKHYATGIGWKGYPGYGPTRCSKLKVFRPKTCGHLWNGKDDESVSSFDKKWRFIRSAKVTPMDLAIRWDLTPENPKEEPKPPTHIDGSNGSVAPAVFSLIHTPKEEDTEPKCDGVHGCGPVFEHGNAGNSLKEYMFDRPKTAPRSKDSVGSDKSSLLKKRAKSANNIHQIGGDSSHSTASSSSASKKNCDNVHNLKGMAEQSKEGIQKRTKSACNVNEIDKQSVNSTESDSRSQIRAKSAYKVNKIEKRSSGSIDSNNNDVQNKIHQSTPDLSKTDNCNEKNCSKRIKNYSQKLCVACEMKKLPHKERRPKSEYKMAFKAGVPQKPKLKRDDYPDHWRLATVYQHSYKPIEIRKRPLLQTVFK